MAETWCSLGEPSNLLEYLVCSTHGYDNTWQRAGDGEWILILITSIYMWLEEGEQNDNDTVWL